jgi:hypothetical protein
MCAPLQVNNRVALFVVLPPEKKRVSLRMRSAAKGLALRRMIAARKSGVHVCS